MKIRNNTDIGICGCPNTMGRRVHPGGEDRPPGARKTTLWVCWEKPDVLLPDTAYLLSFLSPAEEAEISDPSSDRIIYARSIYQDVQTKARKIYIDIVARIGIAPYDKNRTFRQAMALSGRISRWWFHPVSCKDCEKDPSFSLFNSFLTIDAVMRSHECSELVLVGAPPALSAVLGGIYTVSVRRSRPTPSSLHIVLKSLIHRFAFALADFMAIVASIFTGTKKESSFDVVFLNFWDWGVSYDQSSGAVKDKYFGRLPDALRSRGKLSVGWFIWLQPIQTIAGRRSILTGLRKLRQASQIVVLQRFLSPFVLLKETFNFGPLLKYLRVKNFPAFRRAFQYRDIDFFPFFNTQLLQGFLDWSIPQAGLAEAGMRKVCAAHRPMLCVTFLEHFLYSRGIYSGTKVGKRKIPCYTAQHASYNHNKTILFMDPDIEFKGIPDGYAMPHPDKVFAMGGLGYSLFRECGYKKEDVYLTGSPRYDGSPFIRKMPETMSRPSDPERLRVLMVCTLALDLELDMAEAVYLAARNIGNIRLMLRNHPYKRLDRHPGFSKLSDRIEVTRGSLDQDFRAADLVVFTYSTVAEEAYLCGIPVWQWMPFKYNGSALAEILDIPTFSSVSSLRAGFQKARNDRKDMLSISREDKEMVLNSLFYDNDGLNADRIAAQCLRNLNLKVVCSKTNRETVDFQGASG